MEVIRLVKQEEKALNLKEVGVKVIFYGLKLSDGHNSELIVNMAKEIKKKAQPIKNSPEKTVVYVIVPLSAYDYG